MIMPIDIDKKEFSRDKRGYNSREVDEFLDMIVVDYEKILNDNRSMAHKIKSLEKELEEAQQSDTAMIDTLQTAKKLMADISASAERRAEVMIRDAELESENIVMDARISAKKLTEEHKVLSGKVERLRANLRRMLEAELENLDNDSYGLDEAMDISDAFEFEKKEEVQPAKTIVFSDNNYFKENNDAVEIEVIEGEKPEEPAVLNQATISDLSDSLKKMAENETASINDTIILK